MAFFPVDGIGSGIFERGNEKVFSLGGGRTAVISCCSAFCRSGDLGKRCSAFCTSVLLRFSDLASWSFCVRCYSMVEFREARSQGVAEHAQSIMLLL